MRLIWLLRKVPKRRPGFYQQYVARDDENMAREFLNVAADLGHQDAEIERRGDKC